MSSTELEYITLSNIHSKDPVLSARADGNLGTCSTDHLLRRQSSVRFDGYRYTKTKKYIYVHYHVCRNAVNTGEVKLEYCTSTELIAECLTKPLREQDFKTVKIFIPMMVTVIGTM